MKIVVFGATGGVGQHVVSQALKAGFHVTAFVRDPAKLEQSHRNLTVVEGDAFNAEAVAGAIAGHDAVVSCLGSSQGMKKSTELQQMATHIVDGMKAHEVKRIVYTATAGIHKELVGLSGKFVMWLLRHAIADHRGAVEYIQSNDLNYTIVRPMSLTDRPLTGQYREADTGLPDKSRSIISRADVAHFIVKALKDKRYHHTSVAVTS